MYNINLKLYNFISNFLKGHNTIPFIIMSKRIRYIGINLIKEAKDVYGHPSEILRVWFQTLTMKHVIIFLLVEGLAFNL